MINYSPALEPDHLYMISKMLSEKLENLPLEAAQATRWASCRRGCTITRACSTR